MSKLEGKVALVTGAAYGNGREIALRFAREGADLALADIDTERLAESAAMIEALGRKIISVECDVSHPEELEALVSRTKSDLGGLDIAVANAGVTEPDTDCMRMTESLWDHVQGINLKGVFFTLQSSAKVMQEQGRGGRLIAIASVMAGWASHTSPAYCASKGGVAQVVKSFAVQLGREGITCNAIAPGFIKTGMTEGIEGNAMLMGFLTDRIPAGGFGEPGDIGALAAFLASDESKYMNGSIVPVDGGLVAGLYSGAALQMLSKR
jgi:NAD(P)-dependent dehydrogenase (short-subunit alcohol dehydrogenase family)